MLERRSFFNGEWPFDYGELYQYYPEAADILTCPRKSVAARIRPLLTTRTFSASHAI